MLAKRPAACMLHAWKAPEFGEEERMAANTFVEEDILKKVPRWRNYLAAKLGFRNHWYPIRFSRDVPENQVVSAKLLGESILLKRVNGKVFAIRDRCIHRGVRFSEKTECYTEGTITCWYHGFTYKWDSGLLCDVIASPDNPLIGKKKVTTYPVEEVKGLIFVFVGDEGFEVPPLRLDVPPNFLDDDMYYQGFIYNVDANWRIGIENAFDALHIYIHRESPLIPNTQRSLPLGHRAGSKERDIVDDPDGPIGLQNTKFAEGSNSGVQPLYVGQVEGRDVVWGTKMHSTPEEAAKKRSTGDCAFLPCVFRIDNFPFPGGCQYEWSVPVTEDTHLFIAVLGKRCDSEEERRNFDHEFWHRWKPVSLEGFNNQDIMAREAMQKFYRRDSNWLEEVLVSDDLAILTWRELCHKHARGIQTPEQID